jgi:uncharacterized protein involved in tolerance to divalent cations
VDRSLAACEQLYNAGFKNLFWVQGGLEAAEEEVVIVSYKKKSLASSLHMLLPCFFFEQIPNLPSFRISRGKVPSLSSLLLLEGFLNSLGKFH